MLYQRLANVPDILHYTGIVTDILLQRLSIVPDTLFQRLSMVPDIQYQRLSIEPENKYCTRDQVFRPFCFSQQLISLLPSNKLPQANIKVVYQVEHPVQP